MQKILQVGNTKRIFIHTPDKESIDKLAQEYDLHEMIVDNILGVNAQSKIDTSSNNFFLALTFTKFNEEEWKYLFNELDVIIGEDNIITTIGLESQSLNRLFEEIEKEKNTINKIFIKHNFLSQEEIIDDLIHHVNEFHEKHLTTYFNNLKTKLAKIIRTINVLTEKNDSLMGAYNTYIGIKSSKSVTRLTFINSIFMPLTVIAGIWGMSERTGITGGPKNYAITYPLFIILCLVIAYITYILLQKFFMKK